MKAGFVGGEPFAHITLFPYGALPADIEPAAGANLLEDEAVPEDAAGHGKAVDLFVEIIHRQRGDERLDMTIAQGRGPLSDFGQEPGCFRFLTSAHGKLFRSGLFDGDHSDSRAGLHRIVGNDVDSAVLSKDRLELSGKVTTHIQKIGDLLAVKAGVG